MPSKKAANFPVGYLYPSFKINFQGESLENIKVQQARSDSCLFFYIEKAVWNEATSRSSLNNFLIYWYTHTINKSDFQGETLNAVSLKVSPWKCVELHRIPLNFYHMPLKELFFAHKNLFLTFLAAIAIIGIGLFVSHPEIFKFPSFISGVESPTATTTENDPLDRDTDGDGLHDWEERMYGVDPEIADTDQDGTSDGQEVAEGRDPAKKGPDDKLAYLQDPHFATSSTDILGIRKEFFAKFLSEEGRKIREATFQDIVTQAKKSARKFVPQYQIVNLNVISDNSPQAIHTYGNAFGELIVKYTKRNYRTEQEVLADAMQSSSTQKLKDLQLPALGYKNFAEDLKALPTPSSLAKTHLTIVNGYAGMSRALLSMQQMYTDPIESAAGYQAYVKGTAEVTDGYAQLIFLFAQANVTFAANEPGYPFYKYTPKRSATTTARAVQADPDEEELL